MAVAFITFYLKGKKDEVWDNMRELVERHQQTGLCIRKDPRMTELSGMIVAKLKHLQRANLSPCEADEYERLIEGFIRFREKEKPRLRLVA